MQCRRFHVVKCKTEPYWKNVKMNMPVHFGCQLSGFIKCDAKLWAKVEVEVPHYEELGHLMCILL